jgi:hypothetical protein
MPVSPKLGDKATRGDFFPKKCRGGKGQKAEGRGKTFYY